MTKEEILEILENMSDDEMAQYVPKDFLKNLQNYE
jgi:hypothetical protein